MKKRLIAFLFSVLVLTGAAARADLFSGYTPTGNTFTVPSSAFDASGGLLYYFSGETLYRQDAFDSNSFTAVGHFGAGFSVNSFPAFVEFSPDGSRVAIGNSGGADFGTYQVAVFDVSLLGISNPDLTAASSIYSVNHTAAAWSDNVNLFLTAGVFGSPGVVTKLDTTSPAGSPSNATVVGNIGGASAGIAFDAQGNLFTGNGYDGAGASGTGWVKTVLAAAWQNEAPVDFENDSDSILVADLLSANSLAFDAEGNLLVGGGDFGSGDVNYFALISSAALQNLLANGTPIDANNPLQVRKFDPSPAGFSFYSLAVDPIHGAVYALDGNTAYQLCAVPEASTWWMMALGGLLLSWRLAPRRKAAAAVRISALVLAGLLAASPARALNFYVEEVIDYSPGPGVTEGSGFGITSAVLGGPKGGGTSQAALDVLSLGEMGSVTLGFGGYAIEDGPGADFIVFENPIQAGGNPSAVYAELFFVEVSTDGTNFARFSSLSLNPGPIGPFGLLDPALVSGLGGTEPVLANVDSNAIDPFDAAAAGGNAFDLSLLAAHSLVQSGVVDLGDIRFLRLVDIKGDGLTLDSAGNPIYEATGPDFFGSPVSADIDAVSVIHGIPEPSTLILTVAGLLCLGLLRRRS